MARPERASFVNDLEASVTSVSGIEDGWDTCAGTLKMKSPVREKEDLE
jgi:hypothetical protein